MAEQETQAEKNIVLPAPSYWPLVLSVGLPVIGYGVIYNRILIVIGAAIVMLAAFGWALEPSFADESDYEPPADGGSTKELASIG